MGRNLFGELGLPKE